MSEILIPHEKVKAQRIKKDRLISKKQQEINELKDQLTTANKRIEVLEKFNTKIINDYKAMMTFIEKGDLKHDIEGYFKFHKDRLNKWQQALAKSDGLKAKNNS